MLIASKPGVTTEFSSGAASAVQFNRPAFLMCSPEWYGVDYVINPWMAGNVHRSSRDASFAQWKQMYKALREIADVRLLHPQEGSPDMTFVAHGALVNHGVAAVSSFACTERESEEHPLRTWLADAGFQIFDTPRETPFEGEGDGMFDPFGRRLWLAHGARTCRYSHGHVASAWQAEPVSLHLVDPRFYHLDTCFAPLSGGHLLYYPGAFDEASLRRIEDGYPPRMRIAIDEAEAAHFGCNVLNVGRDILMHQAEGTVARRLRSAGYRVTELALSEFLKGGGAAKSLALRLSDLDVTHAAGYEARNAERAA
jgi:N-dimethylarginine dimethylaminohydrolase